MHGLNGGFKGRQSRHFPRTPRVNSRGGGPLAAGISPLIRFSLLSRVAARTDGDGRRWGRASKTIPTSNVLFSVPPRPTPSAAAARYCATGISGIVSEVSPGFLSTVRWEEQSRRLFCSVQFPPLPCSPLAPFDSRGKRRTRAPPVFYERHGCVSSERGKRVNGRFRDTATANDHRRKSSGRAMDREC